MINVTKTWQEKKNVQFLKKYNRSIGITALIVLFAKNRKFATDIKVWLQRRADSLTWPMRLASWYMGLERPSACLLTAASPPPSSPPNPSAARTAPIAQASAPQLIAALRSEIMVAWSNSGSQNELEVRLIMKFYLGYNQDRWFH